MHQLVIPLRLREQTADRVVAVALVYRQQAMGPVARVILHQHLHLKVVMAEQGITRAAQQHPVVEVAARPQWEVMAVQVHLETAAMALHPQFLVLL